MSMVKKSLPLVGLIISFGAFLYALTLGAPLQKNINTNNSTTIRLSDICSDCDIVGGTEESSTIINIHTGETHLRVPDSGPASPNMTHNRYVAPSKSEEVAVTQDLSQVYLVDFSSGLAKKIYTAPQGQGIASVAWAPYEQSIFFSQGALGGPDTLGKNLYSLELNNLQVNLIAKISQITSKDDGIIVLAVSTNQKKAVVSIGQSVYLWDMMTKRAMALNVSMSSMMQLVPPSAAGLENNKSSIGQLLWINDNKVHLLQLSDLHETIYILHSPATDIIQPTTSWASPSGHYVVYVQQTTPGSRSLILLDLISGKERTIVTKTDLDPSLIGSLLWTPDETKIVWPKTWNSGLPVYEAISVDPNVVWASPKTISDPLIPKGYTIEGFFNPRGV